MFKKFLLLNLKDFENIGINFPIGAFIFFIGITLIISLFIYNYRKACTTAFLSGLLRHTAIGKTKAVSLKKLHLDKNFVLKSILSGKSGLISHITARVGEKTQTYEEHIKQLKEKGYKEEKINFDEVLFYIKEDCEDKARDEVTKNDTSIVVPIVISIVIIAIVTLLFIYLPNILSAINNLLE